jgi:hypothetical protein
MVKCNHDQVKRLQKVLQREKDPTVRQRIQMVLLREDGKRGGPGCLNRFSASISGASAGGGQAAKRRGSGVK